MRGRLAELHMDGRAHRDFIVHVDVGIDIWGQSGRLVLIHRYDVIGSGVLSVS